LTTDSATLAILVTPAYETNYRYVPPASGMAVAISAFARLAGNTTTPASNYASTAAGPAIVVARPGNTKMPLPIIAPILIVIVG